LNEAITGAFDAAGAAHPQPGVMTTSVLFTLTMLAHTDYLAIFPRSLCESTPSLRWRDLGGGAWTSPIYIMRRRQAHLNMGARQLLTELTSQ